MDKDRNIPKESFKILFIIAFALIITNCTNKSKGINKLEPIPANAIVLASIDNISSINFSLIEIQQLPNLKSLQFLLRNIEDHLNGDFMISFHPIGAKDFHWLISIPRTSAQSWHPSELSKEKDLKRRSYSVGTIWNTESISLGRTSNHLLLSTSSILTEESIRQIEKGGGQDSYKSFTDLPNKLSNNDFITLSSGDKYDNLSIFYPLFKNKRINDRLLKYRLEQNKSLSWNFREAEDSSSFIAISNEFDLSETSLIFLKHSSPITFPGWRWMVPELNWGAWTISDSKFSFNDKTISSQVFGELCFKGRRNKSWKANVYYSKSEKLIVPNWTNSNEFKIKHFDQITNISVDHYLKSFGPFLVSVIDSNQFNHYASFLGILRTQAQEKQYQEAIKWIKSQPAEANAWWVSNTRINNNDDIPSQWQGLSLQILNGNGIWCASSSRRSN
tara:strand:+ start:665 stop:2002 length:1338 start_codon:yes stop_codon:yes gene_type:complete